MILPSQKYQELEGTFQFHQVNHKTLVFHVIEQLSQKLGFKLKVQKASLQFLNKSKPFAVIALRRSKEFVFVEFYTEQSTQNNRIVREVMTSDGLIINRLLVEATDCYDAELEKWLIASSQLVTQSNA